MHAATKPADLDIPSFDFRALRGKPKRYSVHVNGPLVAVKLVLESGAINGEHAMNVIARLRPELPATTVETELQLTEVPRADPARDDGLRAEEVGHA